MKKMIRIEDILPAAMRPAELQPRQYTPYRYELFYNTDGLHPSVAAAEKAVQWWINDIVNGQNDRQRWLFLFGGSGCGKSHLMKAARSIVRIEKGDETAQMWKWSRLLDCILDGAHEGILRQVQKLPVLLLDDIGAELMSSEKAQAVSMRNLYDILEARLGKWTFLTSNLAPNQIPDARIASRLFRGLNKVIDMRGAADYKLEEYRRRNKK